MFDQDREILGSFIILISKKYIEKEFKNSQGENCY